MDKEEYRRILECLQGKVDDKKLWKQVDTFEVKNGKLYGLFAIEREETAKKIKFIFIWQI